MARLAKEAPMLLVIDVGNTNIVLGVFQDERLVRSWRAATRKQTTSDEYAVLIDHFFAQADLESHRVRAITISSVVPPLNECFARVATEFFGLQPLFVDPLQQDLMPIRYQPAADVGADRIVNALAAFRSFGGPTVVVDFGTATTFDAVSRQGEYRGGIIAPGISISAEALFARAAKLPRIEVKRPPRVIGNSTVTSIQSGIYFGYVGLVDGILVRMKKELGKCHVVATGGLAPLIGEESSQIDSVEENLTLQGLYLFDQWARSKGLDTS